MSDLILDILSTQKQPKFSSWNSTDMAEIRCKEERLRKALELRIFLDWRSARSKFDSQKDTSSRWKVEIRRQKLRVTSSEGGGGLVAT